MRTVTSIIIGAGQSGLAMSHALTAQKIDHLILEKGQIANSWRTQRWDSLRLLTPNWANALPGAPYCGPEPDGYMDVGELANRMTDYANSIQAPLQDNTTVLRLSRTDRGFLIETNKGPLQCRTIVVASGACARSNVPEISLDVPNDIFQITPVAYKRPDDLPDGGVLVVGASATGAQLAGEIQDTGRPVTLAVGWHTRLPRTYRGHDVEWWMDRIGLLDERFDAVDDLARARRTPSPQLIGASRAVDLNALQERGVQLVGRLMDIRNGSALFSGGLANACASADLKMHRFLDRVDAWVAEHGQNFEVPPPDRGVKTRIPAEAALGRGLGDGEIRSIVWATGYRPDFDWIDLPVFDPRGRLQHEGGVVSMPGMYVMGLTFMRRRRSHQISGVGSDARDLSAHMRAYLGRKIAA